MKEFSWKFLIIALCIFSSGCGSEAENKFDELCKKEAGSWVYKAVEVEGYYDTEDGCAGCIDSFVKSNFQFFEYCNRSSVPNPPYPGNGCWRISKSTNIDDNCNKELTSFDSKGWREGNFALPENFCLATKKIDKPSSDVEFTKQLFEIVPRVGNEPVSRKSTFDIKRKSTGETLATQIDFKYATWNPVAGGYASTSCKKNKVKFHSKSKFIAQAIGKGER